MLFMLFGGFLLNKERVPTYCRALSATSFFNYAYEALVINEFHAFPADFFFTTPLATSVLPPLRITGDGVLREFGFNQANLSHDVHMLLLLAGGWGALTYCLLLLLGSGSAECWREEARRAGRAAWARLLAASSAASGYPLHSPCPSDEEEEGGPGGGGGEEGPAGIQQVDRGGGGRAGSRGGAGGQRHHGSEPSPLLPAALTPTAAVHAARPLTSCSGAWFPNRAGGGAPGGQASAGQPGLSLAAGPGGAGGGALLSWENVSCSVAGGRGAAGRRRAILKAVSGMAGPTCWPGGPGAQGGLGGDGLAHVQPGGVQAGGAAGGAAAAGPSCLMAILGPSGAGKTTLLDILAGRRSRLGVSGELRLDGQLVSAEQLRHVSGYVHQDAVLPGTSTVAEYLQFHATLRMPAGTPPSHIEARVSAVIAQLGLSKVAHSTIGDAFVRGLSGGEKRRVSIAVELLTRPAVLLLDEPTTGLDSSNAARVVDILAGLAQSGVTVLLSIHQPRPDIFRLMDRLLLLSGDGQVVFTGPSAAAESHFAGLGHTVVNEEQSMADYVLDLIIKAPPQQVADLVRAFSGSAVAASESAWLQRMVQGGARPGAMAHHNTLKPAAAGSPASPCSASPRRPAPYALQLRCLARRLALNSLRHPLLLALNFGATLFMALSMGAIYWHSGRDTGGIQDRLGSLFFQLLFLALMGLSSLPIWADDRLLFRRERAAGVYGTAAYFTGVVLFDVLPMRLLPPLFFIALSYPMIGLRPLGLHWAKALLVLVVSNVTSASLSMAIGAALHSVAMANLVGSLALLLSMLFAGFLLSRNKMPGWIGWAANLSYARYAFEALASNEFHGATDFRFTAFHQPGTPPELVPHIDVTGDDILNTFGFQVDGYWPDVRRLLLLCAVFLTATYLLLKYRGRG
ncbi:hypothetical protein V8C86DRAFT_42591 [Haematococcus lacustris]